jgi:hypothetical protein
MKCLFTFLQHSKMRNYLVLILYNFETFDVRFFAAAHRVNLEGALGREPPSAGVALELIFVDFQFFFEGRDLLSSARLHGPLVGQVGREDIVPGGQVDEQLGLGLVDLAAEEALVVVVGEAVGQLLLEVRGGVMSQHVFVARKFRETDVASEVERKKSFRILSLRFS